MSIRARIVLLALFAILSVAAALRVQYLTIRGEVDEMRELKSAYIYAQKRSRLAHALQRERGLSAAVTGAATPARRAELLRQYPETDAMLAQIPTDGLHQGLPAIRQKIAAGATSWPEVRGFYTSSIVAVLDSIAGEVVPGRSSHAQIHAAIIDLAWAREGLGLMRATVNRIYSRGRAGLDDVTYLAAEYGKFRDRLRAFRRNMDNSGMEMVEPATTLRVVTGQVEEILRRGPGVAWKHSNEQWWREATLVLDDFKATEDRLYLDLFKAADAGIAVKEAELGRYGMAAIGLGSLVLLLTAFTILRILRALGVLITTLDDVVREENYAIRIPGESPRDEFGYISLSLNRLLDFTDMLIRDKEYLASTDLLTSIMNRRSFLHAAARETGRAERYGTGFALIFADIDRFKQINDTFGHAIGDAVLAGVVGVLRRHMREADLLARWGGEEFVILAPQTTLEQGFQLAEKLRAEVAAADFAGAGKVTCSMGVAEWGPGESFEALCRRADAALYRAKENGRDRVCRAR